jgi:hypothetical protein
MLAHQDEIGLQPIECSRRNLMKRFRFPLAWLMAAIVLVAINLAVIRAFTGYVGDPFPIIYFACGVAPMASLLVMVALLQTPKLIRGAAVPPFVVGFEALGWTAVLLFITSYSVTPSLLQALINFIGTYTRPIFARYLSDTPNWLGLLIEFGACDIIFSSPQLLLALSGGWLTHKLGLTMRFERRKVATPAPAAQRSKLWRRTLQADSRPLECQEST